jgi:hypothetical protein
LAVWGRDKEGDIYLWTVQIDVDLSSFFNGFGKGHHQHASARDLIGFCWAERQKAETKLNF